MPQDLSSDGACRGDLNAHGRDLKNAPVTVFDAVLEEFRSCVVVSLIGWVGDPSTVGDHVFSFWCYPDQFG